MQTQILARVAEMIRNPDARKRVDQPVSTPAPKDMVDISAESYKKSEELSRIESDWERARMERVERIREQTASKSYKISPEVVDQVAEKIVSLL